MDELSVIAALIIICVIIIIIFLVVINPALQVNSNIKSSTEFRDFCLYWSLDGFKKGYGGTVTHEDKTYDINPICAKALGLVVVQQSDIDHCRDMCRLKA